MKLKSLFRGDRVTIQYDAEFRRQYPHTAKMFDGKTGTIVDAYREGLSALLAISLRPNNGVVTLVERKHLILKTKRRELVAA